MTSCSVKMLRLLVGVLLSLEYVSAHKFVVMAPNTFHVGVDQNILVQVSQAACPQDVNVKMYLQDYPLRKKTFSQTEGIFKPDTFGNLTVRVNSSNLASVKSTGVQFVYLVVKSDDSHCQFSRGAKIRIGYRDGLVLIQTDKPIYTPNQAVRIRVFPLDFDLRPTANKIRLIVENPQGIRVMQWDNLDTKTGIISKTYQLSDVEMRGNWTIAALYGHEDAHNTSAKFEVKEYVLPKFFVKIKVPPYILKTDEFITVKVTSRYTYNKAVAGALRVDMKIAAKNMEPILFSRTELLLDEGEGIIKETVGAIKNLPGKVWFPEGGRLLVEATVTEKATGMKEKATDDSAVFTSTPYRIKVTDTPEYFKPGLPFDVKVEVKHPNNKPAVKIPMEISVNGTKIDGDKNGRYETDDDGHVRFTVDVPFGLRLLEMKVNTNNTKLLKEQNGVKDITARAYQSRSDSFLMLRQLTPGKVGKTFKCEAILSSKSARMLTYFVFARGKLIHHKSIKKDSFGILTSIPIKATVDMSPSARLVGYYFTDSGEVVSDSILLKIEDQFPTQVAFYNDKEEPEIVEKVEISPSVDHTFTVKAPPGTVVGLLAVDQSVYLLNNENRMTSRRVFKQIESLEPGCGVGGGGNNREVFLNAGVMMMSDSFVSLSREGGHECSSGNLGGRKKRSSALNTDLSSCCEKGKERDVRSCARRYLDMDNFEATCKKEFLRCCNETFGSRDMGILARNGGAVDSEYDDDIIENTLERTSFPESWLYNEGVTDSKGDAKWTVTVPDTITTWIVQAVAVNNKTGFGMAKPLNLVTFRDFFVSLKLPYSAQRGEQVSVMATVFNFHTQDVTVRLYLEGSRHFCSVARAHTRAPIATLKNVKTNEARSTSFPIVPTVLGEISIKVLAVVPSTFGGDIIKRKLLVLPEGVERRKVYSFFLDPRGSLSDNQQKNDSKPTIASPTQFKSLRILGNNEQTDTIQLDVPTNAVPGSVKGMVYINGDLMGPVVTNLINDNMESLLRYPSGCGEQTVSTMSFSVYVLQYLQSTNQVTDAIERKTYDYIQKGYTRELSIARRDDKSFAIYTHLPGSTWLTAFVMKVFCQARKLGGPFIDPNVMCQAAEWIIGNQREDGVFVEYYAGHIGRHAGNEDEVSLTAFVLISMQECSCSEVDTQSSVNKAVKYLEGQIEGLKELYSLSLATYALSMTSSPKKMRANERLTEQAIFDPTANTRYWDSGWDTLDVETSGYALLAQLALGKMTYAGPIVVWLTEQRNTKGAFRSTHDTSIALQALSKYSEMTAGNDLDLRISMKVDNNQDWLKTRQINRKNKLLQIQTDVTRLLGGNLMVDTTGRGVAQMQVEVRYNVPSTREESCEFKVDVNVKPVTGEKTQGDDNRDSSPKKGKGKATMGICYERYTQGKGCSRKKGPKMTYSDCCGRKNKVGWSVDRKGRRRCKKCTKAPEKKKKIPQAEESIDQLIVNVCTRYKRNGSTTGMSMVEVGIFTGYAVDLLSLEEIKENVTEVDIIETSDRTVVFYLRKIPSDRDICLTFKVHRENDVGFVQPVPVNVYDYYEPSEWCTTFYGPDKRSPLSMGLCTKEKCKCAQDNCGAADPSIENKKKIQAKACNEYDFAFKGEVILIDERNSWLTFTVEVYNIFKQGNIAVKEGGRVEFKKQATCVSPNLRKRTQYVFMGRDKNRQRVLDKSAWVKLWPEKGKVDTDLQEIFGKLSCSST